MGESNRLLFKQLCDSVLLRGFFFFFGSYVDDDCVHVGICCLELCYLDPCGLDRI